MVYCGSGETMSTAHKRPSIPLKSTEPTPLPVNIQNLVLDDRLKGKKKGPMQAHALTKKAA